MPTLTRGSLAWLHADHEGHRIVVGSDGQTVVRCATCGASYRQVLPDEAFDTPAPKRVSALASLEAVLREYAALLDEANIPTRDDAEPVYDV